MQRELSSRASFIYRIIVPVILSGSVALVLWQFGVGVTTGSKNILVIFFVITFPTVMLVLAWHLSRAKRVWLENDELIIAGFAEKTRFPLSNVEKVTATRFWNPEHVRIYFRSSAGVDENIFFYPPIRWFRLWSQHPIAEEIRKLAHEAVAPSTPYNEQRTPTDWKKLTIGGVGLAIFIFVLVGSATQMMKNSEPYQWSLEQVQANPEVMKRLGSPVESSWFITGSISSGGDSGTAFLEYSVSGPDGRGNVTIKGKIANGVWVYEHAGIVIESGYVSFLDSEDRT